MVSAAVVEEEGPMFTAGLENRRRGYTPGSIGEVHAGSPSPSIESMGENRLTGDKEQMQQVKQRILHISNNT